jgi:hypothetical protein
MMFEPKSSTIKGSKKKNKNKKLGSYKNQDDDFFASSALVRNGDYAMSKESWQKVDLNYRGKAPSPIIAMSSSELSSEKDYAFEEAKYLSAPKDKYNKGGSDLVRRVRSSKRR